jgi:predicted membrane-bound spermidine synthase
MLGIALISASILLFEILVLRVFSFTIWHHFAFMVISVALLGFSASGVILSRRPALAARGNVNAAWAAAGFGLCAVASIVVITNVDFNPKEISTDPRQIAVLGLYYLALAVPFTFGGLVVGILLAEDTAAAPRLYAADLVGAGVGALAVVPLLPLVSAEGAVLVAAALALAASATLRFRASTLAGAALLLGLAPWASELLPISAGPGRYLNLLLRDPDRFPERRPLYRSWNALARVDLIDNVPEVDWTQNPGRRTRRLTMPMLVLDGDAATPLVNADAPAEELAYLDHTLPSIPLQALQPRRVLVIGAGGGVDVLTALHHGAREVDAVEINPAVIDITSRRFADRTGRLFERPGVRLIRAEGRSFVAQGGPAYDLIQISLIDTWAASASGAYSLTEGYLYTVEAFQDYFRRLGDGGVLSITRWGGRPPREILKLCSVAAEALRREGLADPNQSVAVLALGEVGSVLVKPRGFSVDDLDRLRRETEEHAVFPVHLPDLPDPLFAGILDNTTGHELLRDFPLDVTPATDDRPYFFQFGRWSDLFRPGAWRERQVFLSGRLVLATVLLQALLFSGVLLLVATRGGERKPGEGRMLAYFLLIGIAFMLVELSLMQRMTLYLGSPLLAASLVLAAVLIGAGLGSRWSDRPGSRSRPPAGLFLALAAAAVLAAFALPALLRTTIGLPFEVRLVLTCVVVLATGVLLGMPLPTAMTRIGESLGAGWVGRAWAANGVGSVLGPVLAAILSIDLGLGTTTLVGGLLYLLAFLALGPLWRPAAP